MWNWIRYANGMSHAVRDELVHAVRLDMSRADPPGAFMGTSKIAGILIDQPGMVDVDRPIELVPFEGLDIEIPSEDLEDLYRAWNAATACVVDGKVFYRFTGHCWRCIVLNEDQRPALLDLLRPRLEQAERRAYDFYATRATPQQLLRDHNQKAHGVPQDAPVYGPDRRGRFQS